MELFQFCLEIIKREVKKFKVIFDTSGLKSLTVNTANNVDYNSVKKRFHFLYRCGTVNFYFAKICFRTFLLNQKIISDLLLKWSTCTDLTFCSISTGPGLDYIALLSSFHESGMIPPLFKNIKIVSQYGAWRNTADIMLKVVSEGYLKDLPTAGIGQIKVLHGDPFKQLAGKIESAISSSDVVVMMKRLNLKDNQYNQKKISNSIKVFLDTLKPGAILFCIDTKTSIKEIKQLLNAFSGTFLLRPTFMHAAVKFDCPKVIKDHVGCLPVLSDEGHFFVWQKSPVSNCNLKSEASSYELKISDHQLANGATSCSTSYLPSTSSQNAFDNFKKKYQTLNLFSSGSSLATACTQTESGEILQDSEAMKIMELSHKIENLTVELAQLLEKREEDICKCLAQNDAVHGQCSSVISCSKSSDYVQNCERCHCSQHNVLLTQCCSSCDHTRIKTSSCGFHAPSLNDLPVNYSSIISAENNLVPPAQLVIPLTNLSADVVAQIVSLISQSKQNLENIAND